MALDLHKEQAAWGGDEQIDLAHVAGAGRERERLPGPVRLRVGHLVPDVPESILFPWEVRLPSCHRCDAPLINAHLFVSPDAERNPSRIAGVPHPSTSSR